MTIPLKVIATIIRQARAHTEGYPKGSLFVFLEDANCEYCDTDDNEEFNRKEFIKDCGDAT